MKSGGPRPLLRVQLPMRGAAADIVFRQDWAITSVIVKYKLPQSVLVVIYSKELDVLLLERADHANFWQSVTGSRDSVDEPLPATARREVQEETGLNAAEHDFIDWQMHNTYPIYPHWRHRYAPGLTHNTETVFGLCVPRETAITLSKHEHTRFQWLDWQQAADTVFSWTNAAAIRALPKRAVTA